MFRIDAAVNDGYADPAPGAPLPKCLWLDGGPQVCGLRHSYGDVKGHLAISLSHLRPQNPKLPPSPDCPFINRAIVSNKFRQNFRSAPPRVTISRKEIHNIRRSRCSAAAGLRSSHSRRSLSRLPAGGGGGEGFVWE